MDERAIEEWARTRDFETLSAEEQRLVLSRLGSREEYDRMRRALAGARLMLAAESRRLDPDPAIASSLRSALARQNRARATARRSVIGRMFTFPVPALGTALGMAAAVVMTLLFGPTRQTQPVAQVVERLMAVHDTVRVATLDPGLLRKITDSVHEEVHAAMAAERLASRQSSRMAVRQTAQSHRPDGAHVDDGRRRGIESPSLGTNQFVGLANLPRLDHQRRGKSLDEDSASRHFAVMLPRGN